MIGGVLNDHGFVGNELCCCFEWKGMMIVDWDWWIGLCDICEIMNWFFDDWWWWVCEWMWWLCGNPRARGGNDFDVMMIECVMMLELCDDVNLNGLTDLTEILLIWNQRKKDEGNSIFRKKRKGRKGGKNRMEEGNSGEF